MHGAWDGLTKAVFASKCAEFCTSSLPLALASGLSNKAWYTYCLALLKKRLNRLKHEPYLSPAMLHRLDLLTQLHEESDAVDVRLAAYENIRIFEQISYVQRQHFKEVFAQGVLKLNLESLAQDLFWPTEIKNILINSIKKSVNNSGAFPAKVLCLVPDKINPEFCDRVIARIAWLFGKDPIILDCFYLKSSSLNSQSLQTHIYPPSFFTKLYLKRSPGNNLIVLKNIDLCPTEELTRMIKYFLVNKRSVYDPCLGDSLSFQDDLIIVTSSSSQNSKNFSGVLKSCFLEKFRGDKLFCKVLAKDLLRVFAKNNNVCFSLNEMEQICSFYLQSLGSQNFLKFLKRLVDRFKNGNHELLALLNELLQEYLTSKPEGFLKKYAESGWEQYLHWNFKKTCPDPYLAMALMQDASDLKQMLAQEHPNTVEVQNHFQKLLKLQNLLQNQYFSPTMNLKDASEKLNNSFFGMQKLKEELLNFLALKQATTEEAFGKVLCLVGPAGVGKTSCAKFVAEMLQTPFFVISCSQLVHLAQLKGLPRSYQQASEGLLAKALISTNSVSPVILIDEIDKVFLQEKNDLWIPFLEVLDRSHQANFLDNYLGVSLDFSKAVFILTSNDLTVLPKPLIDRCHTIFIDGYNFEEKKVIVKEFLLPKLLAKLKPEFAGKINISEEALEQLISKYCADDPGVRQIIFCLESLIGEIIKRYLMQGEWITFDQVLGL